MLRPYRTLTGSRRLSKPYAPIHRRKGKLPSPVADGAVQVPRAELTRDEEGKVRHQVAVHRGSTDFGREVGGQVERDAAVHRGELDAVAPVGAAERGDDRAVHRGRFGVTGGGQAHAAVHGVGPYIRAQVLGFHLTVDGVPVELDARRNAHLEIHRHVVVLSARRPVVPRGALVVAAREARRGVDGADGHGVVRGDDLDFHRLGIAAARVLARRDGGFAARHPDGVDVPVDPFDLEPFAAREPAAPMELPLRSGGRDGASQQREGGEGDGAHGQWSSWSSWCLSCSWPGRRSRMSPLNVSSSSRPLPDPSVKLKRCLVVFVTLTGKLESKSPLNVATDTVTLVRSGIPTVTSPLCVAKR